MNDTALHYADADALSARAQRLDMAGEHLEATRVWREAGQAARLADRGESGGEPGSHDGSRSRAPHGWLQAEAACHLRCPVSLLASWRLTGLLVGGENRTLPYRHDEHGRVVIDVDDLRDWLRMLLEAPHLSINSIGLRYPELMRFLEGEHERP